MSTVFMGTDGEVLGDGIGYVEPIRRMAQEEDFDYAYGGAFRRSRHGRGESNKTLLAGLGSGALPGVSLEYVVTGEEI